MSSVNIYTSGGEDEHLEPLTQDAVTEIQKLRYRVKWLEDTVRSIQASPISITDLKMRMDALEAGLPKKEEKEKKKKSKLKGKAKKKAEKARKAAWYKKHKKLEEKKKENKNLG